MHYVVMTHHWGYLGAFSAALLFGLSATLNKMVLKDVHPLFAASLVYLTAGIILCLVKFSSLSNKILSMFETSTKTEIKIRTSDYIILFLVVLAGSTIAPMLYFYGLNQTTAINASLLSTTETLFTTLIAFTFLKERTKTKDYLAIVLILIAAVFLSTNANFHKLTLTREVVGNVFVVSSCFFWGIDNNLSKFLSIKKDLILITSLKCLLGGILLFFISLLFNISLKISLSVIPYVLSVGALSIGFSILLFLFALREIGAMRTSAIFSTSSFFGAIFASIILMENFTLVQLFSGIIMIFGVYILYFKQK